MFLAAAAYQSLNYLSCARLISYAEFLKSVTGCENLLSNVIVEIQIVNGKIPKNYRRPLLSLSEIR